ncbi:hypothetical protein XH89_13825 [Bradyrhizobium sp. CCBAU 53340]|nr:hypothetical protein XH89_13825 [Bradyrhizobium sp. CCBAU 53340]
MPTRLVPCSLPVPQTYQGCAGLPHWTDARHITQQYGKRMKLIIGNAYLAPEMGKSRQDGNKPMLAVFF